MRVSLTIPSAGNLVSGQNPYYIPFMGSTETRLFDWNVTFCAAGIFNLDVNASCYRTDTGEYVEEHGQVIVYVDVSMLNYTRSCLPHEWIGGGSQMGWHGDNQSWQYTLPFDFPFYGAKYGTIYVSSNGLITFSGSDNSCSNGVQNLAGKLAIAPAWDDWMTSEPCDIYIWQNSTHTGIRWNVMACYNNSIFANFEAILCTSGWVQFNYGENNGTISATVGISNGCGLLIAEDLTNLNYINSTVFMPGNNNPPVVGDPLQEPDPFHVEPDNNVTVFVNVTDLQSGVREAILSYTVDGGMTWENVTMGESVRYNSTTALYQGTIRNQSYCTWVKYKIIAYDNAGNSAIKDNAGEYYVYQVIPEFPASCLLLMPLFVLSITVIMINKTTTTKAKQKHPLSFKTQAHNRIEPTKNPTTHFFSGASENAVYELETSKTLTSLCT
jgi:hypothetical protein